MRISDWSSDVCSSDLKGGSRRHGAKAFDVDVDVAVVKDGEDQEQLAALAPLIRSCAPPSPASGRRADSTDLPRAGDGIGSLGKCRPWDPYNAFRGAPLISAPSFASVDGGNFPATFAYHPPPT